MWWACGRGVRSGLSGRGRDGRVGREGNQEMDGVGWWDA